MPGHDFLLPDELGWECNDELSKCIDDWGENMFKNAQKMSKEELNGNVGFALAQVAKAELIDDMYAIIKKYQEKARIAS